MKFSLIVCFVLNVAFSYSKIKAQSDSAVIFFSKDIIDFGVVYEADGEFSLTIDYANAGIEDLVINRIIAPGLKVKESGKKLLKNNESGKIEISVNPYSKVGNYNKSIIIFSNAANSPYSIVVTGKILPGSIVADYKYSIGNLGFQQSQMNFGYVFKGQVVTRLIPVLNKSSEPLQIRFHDLPDYLSVNTLFDSIMPGEREVVELAYNSLECNDWDFIFDKVMVDVISTDTVSGLITFTANIREDFRQLTEEELHQKPLASIPVKVYNFDTISARDKVKYDFKIKNEGIEDLVIRAVKPTCGCTAALPEQTVIEPGESTSISVYFDAKGYSGFTKKGVTVITNDPINYKQFLWVSGFIQ
ncbi:MAG: DUF1573 domain-containing protein [Bacteroidales bacterium]|nr:DUF1573 domain-containing protein [Bacteroidales bacterium]MBN2819234.1 DUF1573 domain-containing protein [Bacteroidales bacterium]